jgi:glutamyl-tRNA synthetase
LPDVRVRFAPSPTGYLHVGGLRTALYNFLFARRNRGVFVLRIEDTDRARYVEGAVENLIRTLRWAGLEYDEGPDIGGAAGPYVQSERLDIYRSHVQTLLDAGAAYYAFDSAEELEAMRKEQERLRLPSRYDRRALTLTPDQVKQKMAAGVPAVVRMKVPDGVAVAFDDLIRGRVEFASAQIDDQVLLKSDGYPTYHLANVVDDHLMGITHVIRGEEWLSSTPKHVLLYRAFGWPIPQFAHLPLLLNPDKSKLSKRQGDVAVEDYRKQGYLPEALVNFVAFLGWNPGDDRELFGLNDLVAEFSLERVGKSGAVFNREKLDWLNGQHLRQQSDAGLLPLLRRAMKERGVDDAPFSDGYLTSVITAMRERMVFVHDIVVNSPYFFAPPASYDEAVQRKRWKKEETPRQLEAVVKAFDGMQGSTKDDFENALKGVAASLGAGMGELIHPLRLAVSGVGGGPGLYEIFSILGRDETVRRIRTALKTLS